MCGITGILAFTDEGKKHLPCINPATHSLHKRGPDGESIFFHNRTALGHRRLAIIDTSVNGTQPMSDPSGRYTIVFNGEIFNYKQLKKDLVQKGISFHSESDTEVLLQLYIQHKEKCLEKLNGEFAFAIFDSKTESLFLARDRFGIKPLYYFIDGDKFIFSSELKALLKFNIKHTLDSSSLHSYLHLNYIPSPYSIFNEIKKTEPGTYSSIYPDGKMESKIYYQLYDPSFTSYDISYEDAQKKLEELLIASVTDRMISDVPLGTFLSGGIDSSIITAIAAQNTSKLNTFSIGFKDEPFFDETRYAELVAKRYSTNHTVFSLTTEDLFENLYNILDYIDEPFADSSALAVNILSQYTRKHVTVALSGDGADELFGGYNKHSAALRSLQGNWSNSFIKKAQPIWENLPKSRNTKIGNRIRQLAKFSKGLSLNEKERYWRWAGFMEENEHHYVDISYDRSEYKRRKENILKKINGDLNTWLYTDVKLVLENDMLVKTDRMSMANSLEVRVPFLDHKIADFALSIPSDYKIEGNNRKRILKDTFGKLLPDEILNRNKQGFEVPLLKWFRTGLKDLISNDLLKDDFIREQNIFNPSEVQVLKDQLFSHNPDDSVARVWGLVVFQYWWKKHMQSQV